MKELEKQLSYSFKNKELLVTALTHSSYTNERHAAKPRCYERLEFLGDSILGFVTAEFLYKHEPRMPEGRMTRLRAELVCESSLHKIALELKLGNYMLLGKGEERTGGRERPSIMADMVEAIIAAMYLDSGIEPCRSFIMDRILKDVQINADYPSQDYKTMLQELVQRENGRTISYHMIDQSGPDHNKTFTFKVCINGVDAGVGSGRTKKEAEQMAAGKALEALAK
ncbi:MAG: ribonuclease III [Oscillospiraceae bacterium]|nr:ribonuclease III [Oscillospiraceae bacterium]